MEERGDPGNLGIKVLCRGQGSELTGRPSEGFRAVKEGGRRVPGRKKSLRESRELRQRMVSLSSWKPFIRTRIQVRREK